MTLASSSGDKEFVRVVCDHTYTPKDAKDPVSIKIGEEYWLIDKADVAWWFVQNIESETQFFIPANYVEILRDGHGDISIPPAASSTLTKGKNPAPKPKPRTSKTSSSDDMTPRVMTPSEEKAKQCLTRTPSSGESTSQAVMPRMPRLSYENVEIPRQISQTEGSLTTPKMSPGHETKPRLPKMSSEDEALTQLDAVLQAEDDQQMKLMINKQTDNTMAEQGDIKTDKEIDHRTQEQTVKFCTLESFDDSKTTLTSEQEVEMAVQKSSPAVVRKVEVSLSSSSSVPTYQPTTSEIEEDDIDYVNLHDYQPVVKDNEVTTTVSPSKRAESETSDYRSGDSRGGSRESLESKSCDTDSIGTKEDLEKPDVAVQVDSKSKQELPPKPVHNKSGTVNSASASEYANLQDYQKSIGILQSKSQDITDGGENSEKSPQVNVPFGWTIEEDNGEKTFINTSDGEMWKIACDSTGRKYFYNTSTNQTVWNLVEVCVLCPNQNVSLPHKSSSSCQSFTESVPSSGSSKKLKWPSSRDVIKRLTTKPGKVNEEAKVDQPAGLTGAEFSPLEPLPLKMVRKLGLLSKAKIDDQGKKPKKPSWSQSYALLAENILSFYKDQKVATGAKAGKPELTLLLDDAMVSSSPDEKKKEILVLSLSSGVVYYLHHESEEVLLHWKQSLENNIKAVKTEPVSDSKEIENLPVRSVSRAYSYISIFTEERVKIANRLLQWLKRRPSREALQLKGIIKDAVFGSSLSIICEREKTKIPRFVHACLAAVEKRGLDVDGIYRISGNMSLVQKLRQTVDQNEFYDLLDPLWDVHTITGALKLFFRELSEPLFTFALFDEFLNGYRIADRTQKIQAFRAVIKKLPPSHRETMKKLFRHLAEVILHGTSNRMQPQALAIVFGPTLLWPEAKSKDVTLAASMVYQGQVVEFMINEFKSIFS